MGTGKRVGRGSLRDVPIKKDNPYPPEWVTPGAWVEHDILGRGQVTSIFLMKRMWHIGIDFEKGGPGMLDPGVGVPHLRPALPRAGLKDRIGTYLRRLLRPN
jgi:hypothetical protein